MNRNQAKELLPIIQAFAEGKTIQTMSSKGVFEDVTTGLSFDGPYHAYRIKPEPREWWLALHHTEGGRHYNSENAAKLDNPHAVSIIHVREVLE